MQNHLPASSSATVRQATASDFTADPHDRFVVGRTWVQFATSRGLAGTILHGTLTAPDIRALLTLAVATQSALSPGHVVLVEASRVQNLDPNAFPPVARHVDRYREVLEHKIVKLAGVRPAGLLGAVAEGFFRVVRSPYPVDVFATRGEALVWLGVPHLADVFAPLDLAVVQGTRATDQVRDAMERHLRNGSISDVARDLGISVRTLQRRLRDEETTFQEQLNMARAAAAQRLLLNSELPINEIAFEVGYASPSSFTVSFRRIVGQAPREWREAHRAAVEGK